MLFPFAFFISVIILILSSIITAKIFLIVVNLFHKPREGVFARSKHDKDYRYWSLRSVIKKWPAWLARQLNIPVFELLLLKILGIRTSKSNALSEGWVDCEFIELGKNVRLGQGSLIMSNILIKGKLIIKKVVIKDNVVIGAHSVISPGTIIESNTVVDAITLTKVNQHLDGNSVYSGNPAKKILINSPISDIPKLKNTIFEQKLEEKVDSESLKTEVAELSVPFHVYIISGWTIIGFSYIIPAFFFLLYTYHFLVPLILETPFSLSLLLDPHTWMILLITPVIYCGIYLFHLFFVALFTRWFYHYADNHGPAQGVFDRNLDEHFKALDYYHWRSFLLKYPVFAFIRSPFPWLITWELRFIGSNEIGKGTVLEECYIHSHLDWGKSCYVGTFAHISNHLVDGVYGEENLTFYGAKVGDGTIFNSLIGGLPGLNVGDDATFMPLASSIKYDKMGDGGVYAGFPVRKLNKEQLKDFTGGFIKDE